jgi:hypothetical protein
MIRIKQLIQNRRGDEFAQTAIVLPVIVLMTMALFNLAIAGFASVNASNGANYGARIGSVTQQGAGSAAGSGAMQSVANATVGEYAVAVSGGGFPGATNHVTVQWEVPNYFSPLMAFFGGSSTDLNGATTATFRQEGW